MRLIYLFLLIFLFGCGDHPHNDTFNVIKLTSLKINDADCADCVILGFTKNFVLLQFDKKYQECSGSFSIVLSEDFSLPSESQTLNYTLNEPIDSTICPLDSSVMYIKKENSLYYLYLGIYKFTFKEINL
jgi:hypothetical protein